MPKPVSAKQRRYMHAILNSSAGTSARGDRVRDGQRVPTRMQPGCDQRYAAAVNPTLDEKRRAGLLTVTGDDAGKLLFGALIQATATLRRIGRQAVVFEAAEFG